MERRKFKSPFREDQLPGWPCPTCGKSVLRLVKDSFRKKQTKESLDARDHEAWDPEWIKYVYCCELSCADNDCKAVVMSTGVGSVNWYEGVSPEGYPDQIYYDEFTPRYFSPALRLFSIGNDAPEAVAHRMSDSFALFFASPASALNRARMAVEELLTALKVKRYSVSGGNRRPVPLHNRIELLPKKYEPIRELLLAVKWLGNAGSHAGPKVSPDDVLDAYEILESVFTSIYSPKGDSPQAIAKNVNKKKGPRRKRKQPQGYRLL